MLSRILGPQKLRDLAGVIIFSMLSLAMVNKAYIEPQPIDRPELVVGKLAKTEPLIRTIRGQDEVRSIRLIVEGDRRGFLIHPAIYKDYFDADRFAREVPAGTQVELEVRAERLPVIFALRAQGTTYVDKEWVRGHLSGRMMFLRIAALAPVAVTLFCLVSLLRRRSPDERTPSDDRSTI
jgi:hypothetical protein